MNHVNFKIIVIISSKKIANPIFYLLNFPKKPSNEDNSAKALSLHIAYIYFQGNLKN